jgi:hypothetical protein
MMTFGCPFVVVVLLYQERNKKETPGVCQGSLNY